MKIFFLGSNGLIGNAAANLIGKQHEITTAGRGQQYSAELDLLNPEEFSSKIFEGHDVLIHCARIINEDFANPEDGYRKASISAKALTEKAYDAGIRTFIYVSSAHVYGNLIGNIDETTPCNPVSDYAISHFITEQIFKRLTEKGDKKAKVLILRPCATYGKIPDPEKFLRWSLVPFNLPKQAVDNGQITLSPGSDKVKRNFISAESIGRHIKEFIESKTETGCKIINPLGEDNLSILEFAQMSAQIYEQITKKNCPILMPEQQTQPSVPKLHYSSVHVHQPRGQNLNQYLTEMVQYLLYVSKKKVASTSVKKTYS